jgi:hypothetical protein
MMDAASPLQPRHSFEDPDGPPSATWIRAVQRAQHSVPCYRTDERVQCALPDCDWRRACLKLVAAWRR